MIRYLTLAYNQPLDSSHHGIGYRGSAVLTRKGVTSTCSTVVYYYYTTSTLVAVLSHITLLVLVRV